MNIEIGGSQKHGSFFSWRKWKWIEILEPYVYALCDMHLEEKHTVERHIKYTKKIKLNARRHNVKFRSIQII